MAKSNGNISRQKNIKRVGGLYRKKFRWVDFCIYCGNSRSELDHVLPISVAARIDFGELSKTRNYKQGLTIVPSCRECNQIASDNVFFLIKDKRAYIQKQLRKKYLKSIRTVEWSEDEIDDLGFAMKQEVMNMMEKRKFIEHRVYFPALDKLKRKNMRKIQAITGL